jgi:hypothetical protein
MVHSHLFLNINIDVHISTERSLGTSQFILVTYDYVIDLRGDAAALAYVSKYVPIHFFLRSHLYFSLGHSW